ncbi:zinc ribbon domain-containing protein [Ruminococcus sp. AF17-11]|nr:zinc ribbon domain-containing protein [Ruminococcus sp. AF17-11]RGG84422.1 zinc ribbon domain-containing protein [Ruminococcus sp. AF17-11]
MGKDTKFCRNCGKELPIESTFCPYCMTKLIDVTTGGEIKVKKKKPIIIASVSAAVLIAVIAVILLFANGAFNGNNGKSENTSPSTPVVTSAETTKSSDYDYSKYVGIWCDKDSDISTATQNGGNILEIISVKDDVVRFTFTKTSSAPQNRIARISNVTTKVIDGIGTFSFDDDGWQNSGTGKIKFSDGEIYIENTVTNQNSESMWDIGGKFYLKKSESSMLDVESNNFLNADFDDVKNAFGEEISDPFLASDKWYIHYYSGMNVMVTAETNKIYSITVDYSSGNLANSNIGFGEINGNSTYDDVYAELGEPMYNNITHGDVTYKQKDGYVTFTFDDNMNLTNFVYCIEDTH